MNPIDFPYHFDTGGRTARAGHDDWVRDLIEAVLFTVPGERVNRPTFGSGVAQMVFAPNSDELAAATRFLVQGSLQQWLGDVIQVDEVAVSSEDSTLQLLVRYVTRRDQQRHQAEFVRQV